MQILSTFVCDYANMSDGKFSMIGIFQEFNLPEIPFQVPPFYIVINIETGRDEVVTIGTRIREPNNNTLVEIGLQDIKMPGNDEVNRGWIQFSMISTKFNIPGKHLIEILAGKHKDIILLFPLQVNWRKQ